MCEVALLLRFASAVVENSASGCRTSLARGPSKAIDPRGSRSVRSTALASPACPAHPLSRSLPLGPVQPCWSGRISRPAPAWLCSHDTSVTPLVPSRLPHSTVHAQLRVAHTSPRICSPLPLHSTAHHTPSVVRRLVHHHHGHEADLRHLRGLGPSRPLADGCHRVHLPRLQRQQLPHQHHRVPMDASPALAVSSHPPAFSAALLRFPAQAKPLQGTPICDTSLPNLQRATVPHTTRTSPHPLTPHLIPLCCPLTTNPPLPPPSPVLTPPHQWLVGQMNLTEKVSRLINGSPGITRLGLPDYEWWSEALHGVAYSPGVTFASSGDFSCATSFPEPIGLGATFDRTLVRQLASVTSDEARAFSNVGRAGLDFWSAPHSLHTRDTARSHTELPHLINIHSLPLAAPPLINSTHRAIAFSSALPSPHAGRPTSTSSGTRGGVEGRRRPGKTPTCRPSTYSTSSPATSRARTRATSRSSPTASTTPGTTSRTGTATCATDTTPSSATRTWWRPTSHRSSRV